MRSITGLALVAGSALWSAAASADHSHPFPFQSTARALFDCAEGPGWMKITVVDNWGNVTARTVFTGSREDCKAQATDLRAARSYIYEPVLFGVCGPKLATSDGAYMVRYQVDGYGQLFSIPNQYYGDRAECLSDAQFLLQNGGSTDPIGG